MKYLVLMCLLLSGCQSGCTSRYTGRTTKLPCPKEVHQIINMGKSDGTKYLVYRDIEGRIFMREYSDLGVFEATYELEGVKTNKDGVIR